MVRRIHSVSQCLNPSLISYVGSDKAIADLPFGPGNVASGGVGKFEEEVFCWR